MDKCLKDKAHFIIAQTIWNNKNGKAVFAEQVFDRCRKLFQNEINDELYKLIEEGGGGGQGKPGKTPVLKAGTITVLPNDSQPTFALVYEGNNDEGNPVYRMDMGIPQGKDGKDGKNGTDGKDGNTPFIGENKHWWIGTNDTGIVAEGKNGIDGINGHDGVDGHDGIDGVSAGFGEPIATAESVSSNANVEVTINASGPDTAKIFTFHFKIPKGKDGSGGGGTGVDGKTPILQIGNVTTVAPSGQATANVRYTSDDPDGNPIYAIDFGIPSGVKGDDGTDGLDGKTPVFEVGTTTTLPAGSQATVTITSNGVDATGNPKYLINIGIPTGAKGDDGLTPTIGENGNWLIGAVDTGVKALGEDGAVGKTPVFETGEVTTGAAGTAAIVEVVINGVDEAGNPKYKIDFTIPRGADGSGSGGSDRGRILFTLADLHESYRPEIGLSTILPAVSGFALNDCVIDITGSVRQVTAVSEDKQTANLSDAIYTFPTGGGTGGVTEAKVNELIDAKIGDINTILDNINGEVV